MRFKIALTVFTVPLFLAGCGGGDNTHPYDGTWAAVYPAAAITSTISPTQTFLCSTPPATLIIKDSAGTTTQNSTCITTVITPAASGVAATSITYSPQITNNNISVNIAPSRISGGKDVLNAIVNGATFTGQCISTVGCAAVSAAVSAAATLSLTR